MCVRIGNQSIEKPHLEGPITEPELADLQRTYDEMPADYLGALKKANGFAGFAGASFISFFSTRDLKNCNKQYKVRQRFPGAVLVGTGGRSDGIFIYGAKWALAPLDDVRGGGVVLEFHSLEALLAYIGAVDST